jgi:aquaporin Z
MKKYLAEFIGTFTLVLFGCGTAVVAGDQVGTAGIAFAFGFALIAMAYGIGPISGCHINPAVSLGAFIAKRMDGKDLVGYVVGQMLGAIAGAGILLLIMSGIEGGYDAGVSGLGQNGWGGDYSDYGLSSALVFELVATFLFVVVILGATQAGAPVQIAGLAIGIALVVIHLLGIPITGTSVNPARSLGPAIFVGGKALSQLWLFLVIPSVAGILSGVLFRGKVLEK